MLWYIQNACSNIVPTAEELEAFDLVEVEHAPPSLPLLVQPNDEDDFDDFSTKTPEQLLRRSARVSDTSPPPTLKIRKKVVKHKTKVSEANQRDQSIGSPTPTVDVYVSIPEVPPTLSTDVHGSKDFQKVNYVIPNIKGLKDHLKNYVS